MNYHIKVKGIATDEGLSLDLNPEKLYSVDYLLADSGSQLMSFWGHSMFNLVFCSPGVPVDANCRDGKNLMDHVVVSFRANMTDLKLSYLKGLFGGYPSQPFLLNTTSVIREYNRMEKRNLVSVPIKFTAQEKINFVNQIIEMYSSYMGEFKFLTNNCATETKDVIKSVVRSDSAQDLDSNSPKGLLKDLIRIGLVDKNYKTKEYSHFDTVSDKYKDAYKQLDKIADQNNFQTYELSDFIELDAEKRIAWYNKVIQTQNDKISIIILALQLEQDIKEFEKQSLEGSIFNLQLSAIDNPEAFDKKFSAQALSVLRRITDNLKRSERFSVHSSGYGIFLPKDDNEGSFEKILARNNQRDLSEGIAFIRTEAEQMHDDLSQEIKNTGKNVDLLIKYYRESMKRD